MSAHKEKYYAIRITDRGAIAAVTQTIDTLIHVGSLLRTRRIKTLRGLVKRLRAQLRQFLGWLERVPDGTLLQHGITQEELRNIKSGAKMVLSWKMFPSERDYARWRRIYKKEQALQEKKEIPAQERIRVLADTSFFASYLAGSEVSSLSTKVIVAYLKTQRQYFDLYVPNFVLLELISKLKQKYSFKQARRKFDGLLEEISKSRVAVSEGNFTMLHIFERYEQFSKKKLSSRLRSNDFFIATDAILVNAMLLTCDRKMHDAVKKTYQDVYYITDKPSSYLSFINSFEKRKQSALAASTLTRQFQGKTGEIDAVWGTEVGSHLNI
jgi:predicted nucleic acid-binding protein